ncbi:MAG: hypothetical protein HC915_07770 [Anaerolineae bacterium]|nr:hypothetical protein [Anaerolineae bacterium]
MQDYLQGHFIRAMQQVAQRLKSMPHVLGYGPMNEPGKGYLGLPSLSAVGGFPQKQVLVTPAESILLGAGFPRRAPTVRLENMQPVITGEAPLNPNGVSAWQSREHDIWHQVGVWDFDEAGQPVIVADDYFDDLDFLRDGLIPFILRYAEALRAVHPAAILFVESTSTEAEHFALSAAQLPNIINAGHWYDEQMLFSKRFDGQTTLNRRTLEQVHGPAAVQALYTANIAELAQLSRGPMGGIPTLIGEFGVMFDINERSAYRDGDFRLHETALGMIYNALDANRAHATLWNYTPDHDPAQGDGWNGEDLSIFSPALRTNPTDPDSGGRAVRGFCRPYVQRCAGDLLEMQFSPEEAVFQARVAVLAAAPGPTEVYLPRIWLGADPQITVSAGQVALSEQRLIWHHNGGGIHTLHVARR